MIYKKKQIAKEVILVELVDVVEKEGFGVSAHQCDKHYPHGIYYWQKALTYLESVNLVSSHYRHKWYNLIENNITERQWGFIEGYSFNKK